MAHTVSNFNNLYSAQRVARLQCTTAVGTLVIAATTAKPVIGHSTCTSVSSKTGKRHLFQTFLFDSFFLPTCHARTGYFDEHDILGSLQTAELIDFSSELLSKAQVKGWC